MKSVLIIMMFQLNLGGWVPTHAIVYSNETDCMAEKAKYVKGETDRGSPRAMCVPKTSIKDR